MNSRVRTVEREREAQEDGKSEKQEERGAGRGGERKPGREREAQ